jgi:osmoprotectant transport system permease protein
MRWPSVIRLLVLALLIAFVVAPESFAFLLRPLTRNGQPAVYDRGSLWSLTLSHLAITFAATMLATIVALGLAILVTRPFGAEFLSLSRSLATMGQTFPPIAVLALAVPIFGFGNAPTLVALFLYGLLPIFENSLAGLANVPPAITMAARGMGMTGMQRLTRVELPLALPVILGGVRLSTMVSLATATIGSTVAARTLGEIIIAGLAANNTAFVMQGGLIVGTLAVLIYDGLSALERFIVALISKGSNN